MSAKKKKNHFNSDFVKILKFKSYAGLCAPKIHKKQLNRVCILLFKRDINLTVCITIPHFVRTKQERIERKREDLKLSLVGHFKKEEKKILNHEV